MVTTKQHTRAVQFLSIRAWATLVNLCIQHSLVWLLASHQHISPCACSCWIQQPGWFVGHRIASLTSRTWVSELQVANVDIISCCLACMEGSIITNHDKHALMLSAMNAPLRLCLSVPIISLRSHLNEYVYEAASQPRNYLSLCCTWEVISQPVFAVILNWI